MLTRVVTTVALASAAAFGLAFISAVAGFGGGVVLLPVFSALFGLRIAVPVLTLTQLAGNGGRVWFNRHHLNWRLVGWFALGAVPTAVVGSLAFASAPLGPLKRLLGVLLLVMVVWRHLRPMPRKPPELAFVGVGAGSGLGSALLGSVGPLTAPFFLAYGLVTDAYIGTEAAGAVVLHLAKLSGYGAGGLLVPGVLWLGLALVPSTIAGTWIGKRAVHRIDERVFVIIVEIGLVVAGVLLMVGV